MKHEHTFILDTHVWLWLAFGIPGKIKADTLAVLEQASRESPLWVSVVSVWEIALLESKGRLRLPMSVEPWIAQALSRPEIRLLGLDNIQIAIDSCNLPGGLPLGSGRSTAGCQCPLPQRSTGHARPENHRLQQRRLRPDARRVTTLRKENMKTYCLELTGSCACFTRPEMKVERVSYDVMTPSAARACFEAILWKPALRWHVRKIEVLKPIRWINLRRNEVSGVVSTRNVETTMRHATGELAQYIEDERQQRAGLFLRDVAYRIHADLEVLPGAAPDNTPMKFQEMFERRARKGQCVNQPYLGCREFAAAFRLVEDPDSEPPAIMETRDLGFMLHDLDFSNPSDPQPRFFRAQMENGVVSVPAWASDEVRS